MKWIAAFVGVFVCLMCYGVMAYVVVPVEDGPVPVGPAAWVCKIPPDVQIQIEEKWKDSGGIHVHYTIWCRGYQVGTGYHVMQELSRPPFLPPYIDWKPLWYFLDQMQQMGGKLELVRGGSTG